MKYTNSFVIALLTLLVFECCKKTAPQSGNSSLNVVNASVDINNIIVNFIDPPIPFYQNQNNIPLASVYEWGVPSGANLVSIFSATDTTRAIFNGSFILKPGGIYSFFIDGYGTKIDTLFMQDLIPVISDSSADVRFLDLSPGGNLFSVNIAGNPPSQTEFSNLSYRQISPFKNYPANSSVGGAYNFEIRDQSNDSLITTFTWNYTLQKNNTIVLSGLENTGINVFMENNF